MPGRVERATVKEQHQPVAAGYELHSLQYTGKVERKGEASDGLESTFGECGIDARGGDKLPANITRRGMTEVWVTRG